MSKSCSHCCFGDKCFSAEACEDYCPVGDRAEDAAVIALIEENRSEFFDAWFEYINEDLY